MKNSFCTRCTAAVAGGMVLCGISASAQHLVLQHSGDADPLSEGFNVGGYGSPIVGGVTSDLGYDAWSVRLSTAGVSYYVATPDFWDLPWTLSVTLRVTADGPGRQPFYTEAVYTGGYFDLSFGADPDGDQTVRVTSSGPLLTIDGGAIYHNYQLTYDPGDKTADFWVDGSRMLEDIAAVQYAGGVPRLQWGGGYQNPTDLEARWSLVSLEIPEPSRILLLALGGLILLSRRRPRSRSRSQR